MYYQFLNVVLPSQMRAQVSVRTLQNGFDQFLQQAPVEYIRDRRLAVIHESLRQGRASETVTDTLASWHQQFWAFLQRLSATLRLSAVRHPAAVRALRLLRNLSVACAIR